MGICGRGEELGKVGNEGDFELNGGGEGSEIDGREEELGKGDGKKGGLGLVDRGEE